jgi:hypothetical protein
MDSSSGKSIRSRFAICWGLHDLAQRRSVRRAVAGEPTVALGGRKAWIRRLAATSDDACYRAMDWLHQVKDAVKREIFHQVADLLNLGVDLLFSGTTSTYFELDGEDEPVPGDKNGNVTDDAQKAAGGKPAPFRAYGKSQRR